MGWQVDESGNAKRDLVSKLYVNSPDVAYTSPERTSSVTVTGNLNAGSKDTSTTTIIFMTALVILIRQQLILCMQAFREIIHSIQLSLFRFQRMVSRQTLHLLRQHHYHLIHLQVLPMHQIQILSLHFLITGLHQMLLKALI